MRSDLVENHSFSGRPVSELIKKLGEPSYRFEVLFFDLDPKVHQKLIKDSLSKAVVSGVANDPAIVLMATFENGKNSSSRLRVETHTRTRFNESMPKWRRESGAEKGSLLYKILNSQKLLGTSSQKVKSMLGLPQSELHHLEWGGADNFIVEVDPDGIVRCQSYEDYFGRSHGRCRDGI